MTFAQLTIGIYFSRIWYLGNPSITVKENAKKLLVGCMSLYVTPFLLHAGSVHPAFVIAYINVDGSYFTAC